jgi:hypothetical protein
MKSVNKMYSTGNQRSSVNMMSMINTFKRSTKVSALSSNQSVSGLNITGSVASRAAGNFRATLGGVRA